MGLESRDVNALMDGTRKVMIEKFKSLNAEVMDVRKGE